MSGSKYTRILLVISSAPMYVNNVRSVYRMFTNTPYSTQQDRIFEIGVDSL